MFIIVVYDIAQTRVNKVCKFLRKYLNWVQNSVFEGELTSSQKEAMQSGLESIIKDDEDLIILYCFRTKKEVRRKVLGTEKKESSRIL